MKYCQCLLHQEFVGGYREQISWLPQSFAKPLSVVKLKDDGVWSDGWKIIAAGKPEDAKRVSDYSRLYLALKSVQAFE